MSDEPVRENPAPAEGKSKTRPVYVYLVVLFLAALLLLLLSFFMQQRNHQALMDLNNSMTASQSAAELQPTSSATLRIETPSRPSRASSS